MRQFASFFLCLVGLAEGKRLPRSESLKSLADQAAYPASAFVPSSRSGGSAASPHQAGRKVVMGEPVLKIGTRGSPLALAQAYETKKRLAEAFPEELGQEDSVEVKVIKTTGDMVLDKALKELGGKGLFTKELDVALLNNDVDICVHSMKDVPTQLVDGTILPCNLPREDTRDAFISGGTATKPSELPDGSVIGTASLRRQAQLRSKNPTFKCVNFRGNVQTRLKKLGEGIVDATLLATAGLNRMQMTEHITKMLDWDEMLPAVAQGAIGIQCREGDERVLCYLKPLNCAKTKLAVDCERAFLAELDGNCRTPIAGQAKLIVEGDGEKVYFEGLIAKVDGSLVYRTSGTSDATAEAAIALGKSKGAELKAKIGNDALAFYGDQEVLPEPKSSVTNAKSDGLGGYQTDSYAMPAEGKDPGFVKA
jgi:hydroxymethylbilane synthase